MPNSSEVRTLVLQALEAKQATRRALVALPYEEKIRRMFQLQANVQAFRNARVVRRR